MRTEPMLSKRWVVLRLFLNIHYLKVPVLIRGKDCFGRKLQVLKTR